MSNPYASSWSDYENQRKYNRFGNTGQDVARGIFGGPIGWGEVANGKGFGSALGMDFNGTTLNDTMSQDVFDSMTDEEWASYAHMKPEEQNKFNMQRKQDLIKGLASSRTQAGKDKALADKQASRESAQADLIAKVQAFADEMNMPVSELMKKDEFAKALNQNTINTANQSAYNHGIGGGGISTANADFQTKHALLGYQMQRKTMGENAMKDAYGMLSNQNAQAQDISRYNQGLDFQMQQAEAQRQAQQYQQGMGRQQAQWGMIGGIAGVAMGGGPSGFAAGQQLGSNLGGMSYQNTNAFNPYKFKYPSGASGGGGGVGSASYGNY